MIIEVYNYKLRLFKLQRMRNDNDLRVWAIPIIIGTMKQNIMLYRNMNCRIYLSSFRNTLKRLNVAFYLCLLEKTKRNE